MSSLAMVQESLSPFLRFRELEDQVAVPTQCLYPSNSTVTVYVKGGGREAIVTDAGGAIDELSSSNRIVENPDRFLRRFCRPGGLSSSEGEIYSPVVAANQLTSAILLVANASAAAANWGFDHIKYRHRRNLRKELQALLFHQFDKDRIDSKRLAGKSSRTYNFDQVVRVDHDEFLIVDAVLPDPNSINAHAIAHLDLKGLEDTKLYQRLIYDDDEDWKSADLNLLQMAATLIPFSQVSSALEKFGGKG